MIMRWLLIPLLLLPTIAIASPKKNPYAAVPRERVYQTVRTLLSNSNETRTFVIICDKKECVVAPLAEEESK